MFTFVPNLYPQMNPHISKLCSFFGFPIFFMSPSPVNLCVCVSGMASRLLSTWQSPVRITSGTRAMASPLLIASLSRQPQRYILCLSCRVSCYLSYSLLLYFFCASLTRCSWRPSSLSSTLPTSTVERLKNQCFPASHL